MADNDNTFTLIEVPDRGREWRRAVERELERLAKEGPPARPSRDRPAAERDADEPDDGDGGLDR